jgi:hypothetical protein
LGNTLVSTPLAPAVSLRAKFLFVGELEEGRASVCILGWVGAEASEADLSGLFRDLIEL